MYSENDVRSHPAYLSLMETGLFYLDEAEPTNDFLFKNEFYVNRCRLTFKSDPNFSFLISTSTDRYTWQEYLKNPPSKECWWVSVNFDYLFENISDEAKEEMIYHFDVFRKIIIRK